MNTTEGFNCVACTYYNTDNTLKHCIICNSPRIINNSLGLPCSACTFINPPGTKYCQICESLLTHNHTNNITDTNSSISNNFASNKPSAKHLRTFSNSFVPSFIAGTSESEVASALVASLYQANNNNITQSHFNSSFSPSFKMGNSNSNSNVNSHTSIIKPLCHKKSGHADYSVNTAATDSPAGSNSNSISANSAMSDSPTNTIDNENNINNINLDMELSSNKNHLKNKRASIKSRFSNKKNNKTRNDSTERKTNHTDANSNNTTNNSSSKNNLLSVNSEGKMSDTQLTAYYEEFKAINLKYVKATASTATAAAFASVQLKSVQTSLTSLYKQIPINNNNNNTKSTELPQECNVCYESFDGNNEISRVTMSNCGHAGICNVCYSSYIKHRIENNEIAHWIPCSSDDCTVPIHIDNLLNDAGLSVIEMLQFARNYMYKQLVRNENFISCPTNNCISGFIQFGAGVKQTVNCAICNSTHTIEKGVEGELDPEFKKMISEGKLRPCPACALYTLKEYGLCNIICCSKCGIVWNWRTNETGKSIAELKQRARMRGTLWEPGELYYQQQLEWKNPEEFKALLERNGIKYNPNYVRGRG